MLRQRLNDDLKAAMKSRDQRATSALRLILAALKDRDIAARGKGNTEGISEEEIGDLLQKMVRQRRESIELYEQGNRQDLAQQEREEIQVIERFLPKQMSDEEASAAIQAIIAETGASSMKDMGRVMAEVKARHASEIEPARASAMVKAALA